MDVAVFMLIHVAIFVGTIDVPLSLSLLGFHVIIGLNPGSFQLVQQRVKSPLRISCRP